MSYRSSCLSAWLVLVFLMSAGPANALEYYLDANWHPVNKESVYIDKEEFPGFHTLRAFEESSSVESFFHGLIFGFINGFVLSGEDVELAEEQTDFVLLFSSVEPMFEIFADSFQEMSSLGKSDINDKFGANRNCFSFGRADYNGKLVRFDMYVMSGGYGDYYHCLTKHIATFNELSSKE